ncbi:hypothetical protein [Massilibacteroides sp.]|uniref:hypothetical protein n=1 Tax=Massilibacteroides sp. TaxID=2034766 RepID=UPI00261C4179|nr:hypothetical protein [Massilibacteroides sp.]MDD4515472.1 hypothetical protein [Massilibacteroides sp.]
MAKGEYAAAAETAQQVIDSGNYTMFTKEKLTTTGFNSVELPSFMWAIDLTKDNTPALPTFWGHVDYFTYSYAGIGDYKEIPDNLYAEIPETDGRKAWFRNQQPYLPWNKFFDANRVYMGDRLWENDEVYMRIEEMYLIAAEANARDNKLDQSKIVLTDWS